MSVARWQDGKGGKIVRWHCQRDWKVARWQFGKGGRVVRWQGRKRFHLFVSVNQQNEGAGCVQDIFAWPQEWKDSP